MSKNIVKVYQCGGGAIGGKMVDNIAIKFDDGTIEYIERNFNESVKQQVENHMKKITNEQKNSKET